MRSKPLVLLLAACACAPALHSQILAVDAAGVEGLGVISRDLKLGGGDTKFDFGKRSASATYLQALSQPAGTDGIWLYGGYTKIAVPENWKETFRRPPNAIVDLLLNFTRNVALGGGAGTNFFGTLTAGANGESLRWRPNATSAVQTDYTWRGESRVTTGASWPSTPWSTAVSFAATRTTNQADLKEVEVDGRKIRQGALASANAFPVTLRVNYQALNTWIRDLARKIPGYDEQGEYSAVAGVYGTYETREHQADREIIGFSISLQKPNAPKNPIQIPGGPPVSSADVAYWKPLWSVYYEHRNVSGTGRTENKAGAAVLFAWPQ